MKNQEQNSSEFIEQITAKRFHDLLDEKKYTIVDVRDPEAIVSQGPIPGAINLPFASVEQLLEARHNDPNSVFHSKKPLLFCCTGGVMSYMAAIKAQEKGIENICNLEGGHAAWLQYKNAQVAA